MSSGNPLERAALGWANLGGLACAKAPSHSDQLAVFHRAHQFGVRMHDIAIDYGRGFAETGLGLAWTESTIARAELRIQSKVLRRIVKPRAGQQYREAGLWNCPQPYSQYITAWDWSYAGVWKQAGESRARLQIEFHDGLALHDPIEAMAEAGLRLSDLDSTALAALRDLQQKGLVPEIGVGTKDISILPELTRLYPGVFSYFMIMNYNLLDHERCLNELIPFCQDRGIALFLAGPYASGILANPLDDWSAGIPARTTSPSEANGLFYYRPAQPEIVRKVQRIARLAREFGLKTLKPVAVQFVAANVAFARIIFGGRTPAEIEENLSYLEARVPAEFWQKLKQETLDGHPLIHPLAPLPK